MDAAYLVREVPFELSRDAVDGDGLTLEGYAAVFDTPTRIDSWEGCFDETIARGAFKKSIKERTPVLQFDHGRHPMVGSIPLGAIDQLREDAQGLYVRAALHDNWLVQPVRDAIASKSIQGMSFRFTVVKDEWRDSKGNMLTPDEVSSMLWRGDPKNVLQRTLLEVKAPELGPVVFPAYRETTVGVRSQQIADLLADPDLRAEMARTLLTSTPKTPGEAVAASGGDGAARTTTEPGDHSASVPDPRARERALRLAGVLNA